MRRLFLALCGVIVLTAVMASSVSAAPVRGKDPVFGNSMCGTLRCPTGYGDYDINAIIAQANSCVVSRFGLAPGGTYFSSSMGLDTNSCLASEELPKATTGLTMTPQCCVETMADGTCQMHCLMFGIK